MQCPRCHAENREGLRFCEDCGARLVLACPQCGGEVTPGKRFCGSCGAGLTPDAARGPSPHSYTPKHLAEKILTSKSALEGERKHVTVLFADLKGSMELLAERDPEEARTLLDPVLDRMIEAVHRYEGTVNQVMGDGIMALFGAPVAHEDHAVRACYAALDMQAAIRRYAEEIRHAQGLAVQARVGLHSGEVVVRAIGSDLHMDYTAVGQTTHLAARMEQLATPGTTLVTADTLQLAEGFVEVRPLGPVPVKGLEGPVEVYELVRPGPRRTRLHAAAARGLTRFVGREVELEHLRQALARAAVGHGQLAAIVGEAGVGKSRLVWEVTHSHRTHGWLILESRSVSYGKATPYLPVIDLLHGYFAIQDQDESRAIREKLTGKLLTLDEALKPTLAPLLALLDVPVEDAGWQALDPPQRRQRTLEALKRLLLRESQVQPVLVVFEDLHWIDAETQALLDALVESLPTTRVLLLVNYRPEYEHRWGSKTYYAQLRLDPLAPERAEALLDALLGADPTLEPLRRLLVERTEGNPFFLEESVRTLVEAGALAGAPGAYRLVGPLKEARVPASVQAVLATRIDRLPPKEKSLLQTAAVIGKDVPLAVLRRIAEEPEEGLRGGLSHLQAAEFLYETTLFPDLEYTFKHALTHEVAYGSVLQERRRDLHRRIVGAIEALHPERVVEQAETLAHHALRGEAWGQAGRYLRQAGDKAVARSAYREAVGFFEQALAALTRLPETRETLSQALDIRITLGPALVAIKGAASPDVEASYRAAQALCSRLEDARRLFPILWGLWYVTHNRAQYEQARELGERLLNVARSVGDSASLVEAHHSMWSTLHGMGRPGEAEVHCREGIALYDATAHRSSAFRYGGHDPGVCARLIRASSLWELGYPDQALAQVRDGLDLASQLAHTLTTLLALYGAGRLHYHRGETRSAMEKAERLITLGRSHGVAMWTDYGAMLMGRLMVQSGRRDDGLRQLRSAWRPAAAAGWTWGAVFSASLLAATHLDVGQFREGLEVLDALAARGIEGFYEPELQRLRGELLLGQMPGAADQSGAAFRRAIAMARARRQRSLELRAAMSLSRLEKRQGNREEAWEPLADAYRRFTEGFETADLREARALLEELS